MNYLKKYTIFEKNIETAQKELKNFQTDLDLDKNLKEIIESIDGVEVKPEIIFPFLKDDMNKDLLVLDETDDFHSELDDRGLKNSETFNTKDFNTFARFPIKWFWIYEKDAESEELPIYILLQHWVEASNGWSSLKMYYVQKDITEFMSALSEVTLEIRQKEGDKKWTYTTSNSGEDWILNNTEEATETFKKNLDWNRIISLSHHPDIEIVFF